MCANGTPVTKVCCDCLKNVAGERRYKDPQGRYRCHPCYEKLVESGQVIMPLRPNTLCADCTTKITPDETFFHSGDTVCGHCFNLRTFTDHHPTMPCDTCKKLFAPSQLVRTKAKTTVCKTCLEAARRRQAERVRQMRQMSYYGPAARYS